MRIEEIREIIIGWEKSLSSSQKKYIHFYSMRNFVFHYENLSNDQLKEKVVLGLTEYVSEVEKNYFDYKGISSYELARKYLNRLSDIYASSLGFKSFMKIRYVFALGIPADVLFYWLFHGVFFYFPIFTVIFFGYYLYIKISYERKRKVFGIFY